MNKKQRKAKLKRANQHRLMAKSPEYRTNWEQRQDKWVEQMKANGRLVESGESWHEKANAAISFFAQEKHRLDSEKRNWTAIAINCLIVSCILFVVWAILIG